MLPRRRWTSWSTEKGIHWLLVSQCCRFLPAAGARGLVGKRAAVEIVDAALEGLDLLLQGVGGGDVPVGLLDGQRLEDLLGQVGHQWEGVRA